MDGQELGPSRVVVQKRGISSAVVVTALLFIVASFAYFGASAGASASTQDPSQVQGDAVQGWIGAPGGSYLTDSSGRVIFLHGVNAVYKNPPFELEVAPGKPWGFSDADAARMASLGFDVVRLGIIWQGMEPGNAGPNSKAVCSAGAFHDPGQYDPATVERYLDRVKQVVDLLAKYHIYTLLDMHQDVYSSVFGGEGAPPWAVCTGGSSIVPPKGRWSNAYSQAALDNAVGHFWANDVAGDLQGEYIRVWQAVAQRFKDDPWVLGYDLMNEPFSTSLLPTSPEVAAQIECLYTGRADPGEATPGDGPIACPARDPEIGLIPAIEKIDPRHLIFFEPDIFGIRHHANGIGPMDYPNLVFDFHAYCGARSPVTGNPVHVKACAAQEDATITRRNAQRATQASAAYPGGPPGFLSEFGATTNTAVVADATALADQLQLGWTFWSWKYYDDPTGSSDEALVDDDGTLEPTAQVLDQVYPQAVAGTPKSFSFDPSSDRFALTYVPDRDDGAPTLIFVPVHARYPSGYCAQVRNGRVLSQPDAEHLVVGGSVPPASVSVTVAPGPCADGAP